jgi:hypothetical protein
MSTALKMGVRVSFKIRFRVAGYRPKSTTCTHIQDSELLTTRIAIRAEYSLHRSHVNFIPENKSDHSVKKFEAL